MVAMVEKKVDEGRKEGLDIADLGQQDAVEMLSEADKSEVPARKTWKIAGTAMPGKIAVEIAVLMRGSIFQRDGVIPSVDSALFEDQKLQDDGSAR